MATIVSRLDLSGIERLSEKTRPRAEKLVKETAFAIEGQAKMLAPVDTGALRASIIAIVKGLYARVQDGVEYGIFQELGTSRMAAQPFMTPAAQAQWASFIAGWEELFK